MQNQQRHLAAILFTDVVGYTAMMQKNERQAVTLIKRHNEVMQSEVSVYHGEVLNFYGDGCLSIFPSATEALNCSIEIQAQLRKEPVVPLRIGLHIGEVFFEDGKVMGDGVNVASRIQSLGLENTILFSGEFRDKIKNQPEFSFIPLGSFDFKNVDEPMPVFALTNEGLHVPERSKLEGKLKDPGSSQKTSQSTKWTAAIVGILAFALIAYFVNKQLGMPNDLSKIKNSIAVLYFNNMSGDSTQDYFSDGITEEIIARLSGISGLKVKSRTSVLQFKKGTKTVRQIADELGVANILEGSVRKQGNKVRITAQLINTETDLHIWSENYDRELKDVFDVQSDIAQQIAKKFQIKLSETDQKKLATPPTQNMDAYDLYLKANNISLLADGVGGNNRKAIKLLQQAILLDPSFSDAYAAIGNNYATFGLITPNPKQWFDSVDLYGNKAIALGPDREAGYLTMADLKKWQGQYDESLIWLYKANEIRPGSINGAISEASLRKNEYGKAYEWVQKAIELDPTDPGNYAIEADIFRYGIRNFIH